MAIAFAIHAPALDGWWRNDDPQVLVQAARYTPEQILFSPHAWRTLSASNFTPLVTLSFQGDLHLAGLHPTAFYLHQIAALGVAAFLLFLLVARFTNWLYGTYAALIFLLTPITAVAARSLMLRHYVEGLALAVAATLCWMRGGNRPGAAGWFWSGTGALLYLGAALAKEVYAPLPLLMLAGAFVAGERIRSIALRTVPLAIAAGADLLWRNAMLGSFGGYGAAPTRESLLALPWRVWSGGFGTGSVSWAIVVVTLAGAAIFVMMMEREPRRTLLVAVTMAAFAFVPLIAVATDLDPRHSFALTAGAVALLAIGAGRSSHAKSAIALLTVIAVATGVAGVRQGVEYQRWAKPMEAEGKYVWNVTSSSPALLATASVGTPWYLEGLEWLRSFSHRGGAPRFIGSLTPVALGEMSLQSLVRFNPENNRIEPVSDSLVPLVREDRSRYDRAAALEVTIGRKGTVLHWSLAPRTARFTFVSYPGYFEFPITPDGRWRVPEPTERQHFRIRGDLPGGSWTISPPLTVPGDGQTVRWSRADENDSGVSVLR